LIVGVKFFDKSPRKSVGRLISDDEKLQFYQIFSWNYDDWKGFDFLVSAEMKEDLVYRLILYIKPKAW